MYRTKQAKTRCGDPHVKTTCGAPEKAQRMPARKAVLQKMEPAARGLVVGVGFAGADGAGEAAIKKYEIDGGEDHTDDPPSQTDP
jgi:hypothetical protein